MTIERSIERRNAWLRLMTLLKFRASGVILEAGEDWLDKEISDLVKFLEVRVRIVCKVNRKMTTFRGRGHLKCINKFSQS